MYELITKNKIAHLRFNRPDKRNSLLPEFWSEFPGTIREIGRRGDVRAIVISAIGKDFCSGMDLSVFAEAKSFGTGSASERDSLHVLVKQLQEAISVLETVRLPVIAAIQGGCVGAGLDLVSALDIRYATESAFFSIFEINLGIMADLGTLQRLPRKMPEGIVRELAYTGERLSASRAYELGFVNRVFSSHEELVDEALATAEAIASKAPLAISHSKACLNYSIDHTVDESLEFAAARQAFIFDSEKLVATVNGGGAKVEHQDLLPEWTAF